MAMRDGVDDAVAGLIISDGQGQYFAIAWPDLQRHRVPAAWAAAVAVAVGGGEPVDPGEDVYAHEATAAVGDDRTLLVEATAPGRFRLASRRLEAWLLLR